MSHRRKYVDSLPVNIFDNREQMGEYAASEAASFIKELAEEKDEINILFAAAPSQDDFLNALGCDESIPWEKVNAFQLDDYIGIEEKAPQRFANYLRRTIFDKIPLRQSFLLNPQNADSKEEAERYASELQKHSPDIAFIGIGENGHIAFNDPGIADFDDPLAVREVMLDERSRVQQVNDGCFERLECVPKKALTLTIPTILNCRKVFCIVPGRSKAQAVFDTLYAEFGSSHPSTALRKHGQASLYLDGDSADKIRDLC